MTRIKGCAEQDTFFNMLFVIGCAVSNASGLLYGIFLLEKHTVTKLCRLHTGQIRHVNVPYFRRCPGHDRSDSDDFLSKCFLLNCRIRTYSFRSIRNAYDQSNTSD